MDALHIVPVGADVSIPMLDLEAKIKRSDWGISTYVPMVGDEVELTIEVEAMKK